MKTFKFLPMVALFGCYVFSSNGVAQSNLAGLPASSYSTARAVNVMPKVECLPGQTMRTTSRAQPVTVQPGVAKFDPARPASSLSDARSVDVTPLVVCLDPVVSMATLTPASIPVGTVTAANLHAVQYSRRGETHYYFNCVFGQASNMPFNPSVWCSAGSGAVLTSTVFLPGSLGGS